MSQNPSLSVQPLAAAEPYEQDEPGDATFRWLLKKDDVPGLQIGHVTLKGPIHKTPAAHDDFHQVYLVTSGSGAIHLGDTTSPLAPGTRVVIPRGTTHSVEVPAGGELRYVFINQYR